MEYEYNEEIRNLINKYKDILDFYRLKLRKFKGKNKGKYRYCLIKVDETQCQILKKKDNVNPYYVFELIEKNLQDNNYYNNKLGKAMCFREERLWKSLT